MAYNVEDTITDYLSGNLDAKAKLEFEAQIAANPELAARVAFEKSLIEALGAHAPENQLRANLSQIAKKFDGLEGLAQKPAPKNALYPWLLTALGLLLLSGIFLWFYTQQQKNTPLSSPKTDLVPNPPPVQGPMSAPETTKQPVYKQPQPIASAFKPIPALERYIGSQTRNGSQRIRVDNPPNGSTYQLHTKGAVFQIAGQIEGDIQPSTKFNCLIFSNNLPQFEAMRPLLAQALEYDSTGTFSTPVRLNAPAGLYYLLIENPDSGAWMWVGKILLAP